MKWVYTSLEARRRPSYLLIESRIEERAVLGNEVLLGRASSFS